MQRVALERFLWKVSAFVACSMSNESPRFERKRKLVFPGELVSIFVAWRVREIRFEMFSNDAHSSLRGASSRLIDFISTRFRWTIFPRDPLQLILIAVRIPARAPNGRLSLEGKLSQLESTRPFGPSGRGRETKRERARVVSRGKPFLSRQ